MNPIVRGILYVVLIAGISFFTKRFFAQYAQKVEVASHIYDSADTFGGAPPPVPAATPSTNTPPLASGVTAVNPTNQVAVTTNSSPVTNSPATNHSATTHTLARGQKSESASPPPVTPRHRKTPGASMGLDGALALVMTLMLALLVGFDVSHYVAHRAHRELYNENAEGIADPEYDQAEEAWANGDHLEAVRLMREHLRRHPREVHVSLRIAEIYEKDLHNPLAAALEYEEILKFKLEPERWGWAAIHLCNLYYKLPQPEKAEALLGRIVKEYGGTAAARKARARLGIPEVAEEESEATESPSDETAPGTKLPPGFRPKKG